MDNGVIKQLFVQQFGYQQRKPQSFASFALWDENPQVTGGFLSQKTIRFSFSMSSYCREFKHEIKLPMLSMLVSSDISTSASKMAQMYFSLTTSKIQIILDAADDNFKNMFLDKNISSLRLVRLKSILYSFIYLMLHLSLYVFIHHIYALVLVVAW